MQINDFSATRQRRLPAWLLSVLLHGLLLALMLTIVFRVSDGAAEVENKTGGIVLVDLSSQTTRFLSEGDVTASTQTAQQPPPATAIESTDRPPSLPGFEVADSPITGIGVDFSDSITGADSLTFGDSYGQNFVGKVTTSVFGVEGTGSRFVYVFDRSASMENLAGKPLRAAKANLLQSLESLGEQQQFQIIFYNAKTRIFQGTKLNSLSHATEREKEHARRFVRSIEGEGGTDHKNALRKAFTFAPDVIFLLTDAEGGLSSVDLASIQEWNSTSAVINTIEFGVGSKSSNDQSLKFLAEQSGGQYVYKDVRSFKK